MTDNNYYIKLADIHDYNFFYSQEEQKESCVTAYVLMNKKRRLAIGGLFLREKGCIAFVKVKEDLPKKLFFKEIKKGLAEMSKLITLPIYAIRDCTINNSDIFLEKLGFKYFDTLDLKDEIYIL